MEILAWIIGIPIALFIAYRIFYVLSIFERGIFLGIILGIVCMQFDWSFWIGAGIGFVLGCIVLPFVCARFGFDYEFLGPVQHRECPHCGSTRLETRVESTGNNDYDTYTYCKNCGKYVGY